MSFKVDVIDNYKNSKLGFSIDKKKAAAELRRLADEIEKPIPEMGGEYICLQDAITMETVSRDDYAMTTLILEFATKKSDKAWTPA
jgi:hypothetical protein